MLNKEEVQKLKKIFFNKDGINTRQAYLRAILFSGAYNLDDKVFLQSIGKDLQRGYVWELWRKKSFLISLFAQAPQKPMAFINKTTNLISDRSILEVIDGKQRINAINEFFAGQFSINLNNKEYFAHDFGTRSELEVCFLGCTIPIFWIDECMDSPVSDKEKKSFFNWLNFDNHLQDKARFDNL